MKIVESVNLFAVAVDIYRRMKFLFVGRRTKIKNNRFKRQLDSRDCPLPPAQLVYLVTGAYDVEGFCQNGSVGAESIKSILKKHNLEINSFKSILDFGCGCGRIMRNWKTLAGPKLYGTDYNPVLVEWCRRNLLFAEFKTNKISSRLEFGNDTFDFIYAISVFTHLNEDLQDFWLEELTRVLKPGAFLLVTVHGTTRLHQLSSEKRKRFESGEFVADGERMAGSNICCAYHPEQYIRNNLARKLHLIDFLPGGAKDANQDAVLLQKPPSYRACPA